MAIECKTHPAVSVAALWYTRCPVPTASSLAIDHGWLDEEFERDGITVSSLRASGEQSVRESHFDHTQSNSFRQGGNIPPIWTRACSGETAVVALSWVDEYQAIVAMPDSGICTAKDLRGRRLGLPRRLNDQIDFWRARCLRGYLSALALEGMDERDVELVDLPVPEKYLGPEARSHTGTLWSGGARARRQKAEAFALIRGAVDAIYTAGATGAQLTAFLGAREVIDLGRHPNLSVRINNSTPTTLTVSGTLARNYPDLVGRFLGRLTAAARWAETHRSEVVRIVANDVCAPEEWVEVAYGTDFHQRLTLELTEESISAIESQKTFLLKWGFIEQDFDVRGWIDPKPLALSVRSFKH